MGKKAGKKADKKTGNGFNPLPAFVSLLLNRDGGAVAASYTLAIRFQEALQLFAA